jgi:hypothetical protein
VAELEGLYAGMAKNNKGSSNGNRMEDLDAIKFLMQNQGKF